MRSLDAGGGAYVSSWSLASYPWSDVINLASNICLRHILSLLGQFRTGEGE